MKHTARVWPICTPKSDDRLETFTKWVQSTTDNRREMNAANEGWASDGAGSCLSDDWFNGDCGGNGKTSRAGRDQGLFYQPHRRELSTIV